MGENSEAPTGFAPKTMANILLEVAMIDDFAKKSARLDFYVNLLQEEMKKLDAFKRELPQCMYLIQDAIDKLNVESLKWKARQMELKNYENGRAKGSDDSSEKRNWLSSAQLWNTTVEYEDPDSGSVKYQQGEGSGIGRQGQGSNFLSMGGAYVPFKKQMEEKKGSVPVDGLSLTIRVEPVDLNVKKDSYGFVRPQLQQLYPKQHKKQRRCWSPELHMLFVDALQQLGGHKSATPKSIRELMKVDGLTNDEVKSHLQKFRLHIKKLPGSSADGAGPNTLALLNKNQDGDLNKATAGSSTSPQGPLQIGPGPLKLGSSTAGESMDENEDASWMGMIPRPTEKKA